MATAAERSSALRSAGEAVLGIPKIDYASAAAAVLGDNHGRVVKRAIAKQPVRRVQTVQPPDKNPDLASLTAERVQLHQFGVDPGMPESGSVKRLQSLLTRRHSIETGDLPQLRKTNCSEACFSLAFSPDSGLLAGGFFDGMLRIFDSQSGTEEHCVSLPVTTEFGDSSKSPSVTCVRWLPDSGDVPTLATSDAAGAICLWRYLGTATEGDYGDQALDCVAKSTGGLTLNALCVTPDGSRIAAAGAGHVIRAYDIQDGTSALETPIQTLGECRHTIPGRIAGHGLKVVCLKSDHSNPNLLLSAGIDRKILRWDMRVGCDAIGCIHGPQLMGDAMDISRDGLTLLTGSHRADKSLQLFDMRRLNKHFSTLAEASGVYSWNGDELGLDTKIKGSTCLLFGVAWDSGKNKTIAAAGQHENAAKVFARRDDPLEPLHTIGKIENIAGGFWSVAAAPDGGRVAFGSVDGTVHLSQIAAESRFGSYTVGYGHNQNMNI